MLPHRLAVTLLALILSSAGFGDSAPTKLGDIDVGSPKVKGSIKEVDGGLDMVAGGKDVWGASDQFHFASQAQTGDFDAIVRVSSLTAVQMYTRAGIMARASLEPDSAHIFFVVFSDNSPRHNNKGGYELQFREKAGGTSAGIYPPANSPTAFRVYYPHTWLRLRRRGNEFTVLMSHDGEEWKFYGSQTVILPATVQLGLALTSHDPEKTAKASFRDYRVQP